MLEISRTVESAAAAKDEYVYHHDPGHGWLEVCTAELIRLGIEGDITPYSYRGTGGLSVRYGFDDLSYLEEDCDMAVFCDAKRALGEDVKREYRYTEDTPIRQLPSYSI